MPFTETVLHRPVVREDSRSFGVIFALGFVVFLPIALLGQFFGFRWRSWMPGAEGVDSIFGGVKAAVYTFMSHLF